ncbi:MAG TPA: hypothetical protein DCE44_22920 [Verrucomicrobiales bacterium]|nr:hypothetical protein [Verrucomicrobiales bacterium]
MGTFCSYSRRASTGKRGRQPNHLPTEFPVTQSTDRSKSHCHDAARRSAVNFSNETFQILFAAV